MKYYIILTLLFSTALHAMPRSGSAQGLTSPVVIQAHLPSMEFQNDTLEARINLYSDKTGTQLLWTGQYSIPVNGGRIAFDLQNGKTTLSIPSGDSGPVWLGIQYGRYPEARPLTQISASAVALSVPDQSITTEKLVDNAVDATAISFPYLKLVRINGNAIASEQGELLLKTDDGVLVSYDSDPIVAEISADIDLLINPRKNPRISFIGQDNIPNPNSDGGTHQNSIGAGENNTADGAGEFNSVMGGQYNEATGGHATVIGGSSNRSSDNGTTVGGGLANGDASLPREFSAIGGGTHNFVEENYGVLIGGDYNDIQDAGHAAIGGGKENTFISPSNGTQYSTIIGGGSNYARAPFAFVGGGGAPVKPTGNEVLDEYSVVVGGNNNESTEPHAFIGGGKLNRSSGPKSVILGGESNNATYSGTEPSVILGGHTNVTTEEGASMLGGKSNTASGHLAVVGGGEGNIASGSHAVTYGGQNLIAQSYAQTVIGFNNFAQGTSTPSLKPPDDRLFIVGNGISSGATDRSNAFEVTNTGHSIVFDVKGDLIVGDEPHFGGTYVDNTLCAWGDFDGSLGPNGAFVGTSSFGVIFDAINSTPGDYLFQVINRDPHSGMQKFAAGGQFIVTATPVHQGVEEPECIFISSSNASIPGNPGQSGSHFRIHTRTKESCAPVHTRFCFKVIARLDRNTPFVDP